MFLNFWKRSLLPWFLVTLIYNHDRFTDGHQRTTNNGSRNAKTPTSPVPSALKANKEYVRHKVDYLGALPISASRSTNLAALQRPLKELYFKWRALRNLGHSNLPGTLEINDTGLTVQYIRELHKGVQVSDIDHFML